MQPNKSKGVAIQSIIETSGVTDPEKLKALGKELEILDSNHKYGLEPKELSFIKGGNYTCPKTWWPSEDLIQALKNANLIKKIKTECAKEPGLYGTLMTGPWDNGKKDTYLKFQPDAKYLDGLFKPFLEANKNNPCPCGHPPFISSISQLYKGKIDIDVTQKNLEKLGPEGAKKLEQMIYRIISYNPTIAKISIEDDIVTIDGPYTMQLKGAGGDDAETEEKLKASKLKPAVGSISIPLSVLTDDNIDPHVLLLLADAAIMGGSMDSKYNEIYAATEGPASTKTFTVDLPALEKFYHDSKIQASGFIIGKVWQIWEGNQETDYPDINLYGELINALKIMTGKDIEPNGEWKETINWKSHGESNPENVSLTISFNEKGFDKEGKTHYSIIAKGNAEGNIETLYSRLKYYKPNFDDNITTGWSYTPVQ